jgi:hypothetical protein
MTQSQLAVFWEDIRTPNANMTEKTSKNNKT